MSLTNLHVICYQGCVKVWDISQSSGKNPISTLECLVSCFVCLLADSITFTSESQPRICEAVAKKAQKNSEASVGSC